MIDDDFLKAIGALIVEWEDLEWALSQAIWAIGKLPWSSAVIMTAHINTKERTEMLEALGAEWLKPGLAAESARLARKIRKLKIRRNNIVHRQFGFGRSREEIVKHWPEARSRLNIKKQNLRVRDITSLQVEIVQCYKEVLSLISAATRRSTSP